MSQPPEVASGSKKRKASPASPSVPLANRDGSPTSTVSDLFNDPSADVELVSSDLVHFKIQRFYLQAASPVFVELIANALPSNSNPTIIELEETSKELNLFLQQIHPSHLPRRLLSYSTVLSILKLAKKYKATTLSVNLSKAYLSEALQTYYPGTATATGYKTKPSLLQLCLLAYEQGHLALARQTIEKFGGHLQKFASPATSFDSTSGSSFAVLVGSNIYGAGNNPSVRITPGVMNPCLDDLTEEELERLGIPMIKKFSRILQKVQGVQGYSWYDAAREFTF